jgi:hypothetical protein
MEPLSPRSECGNASLVALPGYPEQETEENTEGSSPAIQWWGWNLAWDWLQFHQEGGETSMIG